MNEGRELIRHVDGTAFFRSPLDQVQERQIADACARRWGVEIGHFPALHSVDFWAGRNDRMVGVFEAKWRNHAIGSHPTTIIPLHKYDALIRHQLAHSTVGIAVFRFDEGIFWIRVSDIDARAVRITGPKGGPYEPHVDIPTGSLIPLRRGALRLSGPP